MNQKGVLRVRNLSRDVNKNGVFMNVMLRDVSSAMAFSIFSDIFSDINRFMYDAHIEVDFIIKEGYSVLFLTGMIYKTRKKDIKKNKKILRDRMSSLYLKQKNYIGRKRYYDER